MLRRQPYDGVRAGRVGVPRRIGRPQGRRRAGRLDRAGRGRVGPHLRRTAGAGQGAGLRGGAGDVRGVGRAAGGPPADSVVEDTTSDEWEADRHALLDRSVSLAELLARRGLVLRADLLRPWSRWITPVMEPRRFDTRFFAAALPAGQRTRDVGGEASEVAWVAPAEALAAGQRDEIRLMPPTRCRCPSWPTAGPGHRADRPAAGRADHPGGPAARGRGLADRARPYRLPDRPASA